MNALRHLDARLAEAEGLFAAIRQRTADGPGVTRATYGEGETAAAEILAAAARKGGLEVTQDAAANLYMALPGRDRLAPRTVIGSHLDSVRRGGNYDGLAGVIAGLAIALAFRDSGQALGSDLTVMGIRGEENAWFGVQHIGSRAALGLLDPALLEGSRRSDSGRSLADHMRAAGGAPDRLGTLGAPLPPATVRRFLELHIEQGPVLEAADLPVGVVTAIRGNVRCPEIRCLGEYGHSGAMPRSLRRDAVLAVAEVFSAVERRWDDIEAAGGDLLVTFGTLATDPAAHGITTVPGEVRFSFDARSYSAATLAAAREALETTLQEVAGRRGVRFEIGRVTGARPVAMDARLQQALDTACQALDVPAMALPSGPGHDAADFCEAGIPTAMLFVRNFNGSHNPAEDMRMDDFAAATRVLAAALLTLETM